MLNDSEESQIDTKEVRIVKFDISIYFDLMLKIGIVKVGKSYIIPTIV